MDKDLNFYCYNSLSGAIVGTLLGLINQVVVEPYIDKAIGIETQREVNAGKIIDPTQQLQYRMWQKLLELCTVYLTGIMFVVLFLIPTIKYPANPPAVGNPDTRYYRKSLYVGFIAISGFIQLGTCSSLHKKASKEH